MTIASEITGYLYPPLRTQAPLPIGNMTLLGTDEDCDIALKTGTADIGARHCKIERKATGVVITDLRSGQGTFVNATKIVEAFLEDGDDIRIGDQHFTYSQQLQDGGVGIGLASKNESWNQQLHVLGNVAKNQLSGPAARSLRDRQGNYFRGFASALSKSRGPPR